MKKLAGVSLQRTPSWSSLGSMKLWFSKPEQSMRAQHLHGAG